MIVWIGVALLGGVGACARFLVDGAVPARSFPLGTLVVNLSGAFVLGLLSAAGLSDDAYLLAGTATLGAYTTFSTWMLESHRGGEGGDARVLWANIAVSLIAGLVAVALGHWIGRLL